MVGIHSANDSGMTQRKASKDRSRQLIGRPATRRPQTLDDLKRMLLRTPRDRLDFERAFVCVGASNFLQALRASARLSQHEVALRSGMTQSDVSRLERASGTRAPELATIMRFARACGFDLFLVGQPRRPARGRTRQLTPLTPDDF